MAWRCRCASGTSTVNSLQRVTETEGALPRGWVKSASELPPPNEQAHIYAEAMPGGVKVWGDVLRSRRGGRAGEVAEAPVATSGDASGAGGFETRAGCNAVAASEPVGPDSEKDRPAVAHAAPAIAHGEADAVWPQHCRTSTCSTQHYCSQE